jgi:hypothetical protein
MVIDNKQWTIDNKLLAIGKGASLLKDAHLCHINLRAIANLNI